jgi:hypothetical protein
MSQVQDSSLLHYRESARHFGKDQALREAANDVDELRDALGRRRDAKTVAVVALVALSWLLGFAFAWLVYA